MEFLFGIFDASDSICGKGIREKQKERKKTRERERTKEGSFYYVTIHQEVYSPHPRKEPAPNPIRLSP